MEHRLGIIGFGGMANWHVENLKRVEGLQAVAVFDINENHIQNAEHKGLRGYRTLEGFLQDDSFDIVLVATPNDVHKSLVISALEAGKHVVCEKPAAMNAGELEEMIEVSRRTGKLLTVHHNRRWDRDFQMVKQTVESGKLGKVYNYESRVHGQNGILFGWRDKKAAGGGVLRDWSVHMIDQLLQLTSERVTEVYAQMHSVLSAEVEDYFKLLLRFESGTSALVEVGTYCFITGPRWVVHGDKGSMLVENWSGGGCIVTGKEYEGGWTPEIIQTVAGPTRTMAPRPKETLVEEPLPEVIDGINWTEFYSNLMDAIEGRAKLLVTPEQALRVKCIIDCAFQSNQEGQSIKTCI